VLGLPVVLGTAPPDEAGEASRRLEQALAIMAYRPIERLEHAVIARALGLTRSMLLVTNALVTLKAGDALSAEAILKGATWLEAPSSLLHLTFAEICVAQLELNPAAPEARTLRKRAHSHLWTVLWLERRRTRGLLRRRARALLRALVRRQRLALHPPAPPDTPAAGPTVFISYASEDRAFVKVLGDALAAAKIECCIDWQSSKFEPGLELLSVLGSAVDEGERVLFCASRNSLTKHHTDVELTLAFEKERELRMRGADGDIVIPLDLDGFMFQTEDRNPKRLLLTSRVVASFKGWQPGMDLPQAELARLVRAIQRTHRPDRP
jgi:hypothetical protein